MFLSHLSFQPKSYVLYESGFHLSRHGGLVVAGIKHTKISTSAIICTLSSVFKIHASWDALNSEMRALCCWWSRPNGKFRCSPTFSVAVTWLAHTALPRQRSQHRAGCDRLSWDTHINYCVWGSELRSLATWQVLATDASTVPLGVSE